MKIHGTNPMVNFVFEKFISSNEVTCTLSLYWRSHRIEQLRCGLCQVDSRIALSLPGPVNLEDTFNLLEAHLDVL